MARLHNVLQVRFLAASCCSPLLSVEQAEIGLRLVADLECSVQTALLRLLLISLGSPRHFLRDPERRGGLSTSGCVEPSCSRSSAQTGRRQSLIPVGCGSRCLFVIFFGHLRVQLRAHFSMFALSDVSFVLP